MDGELLKKDETPNCIWTAEHEAPHRVFVGNTPPIEMPDDKTQRKGFFSDRAHVLVSLGMGWKIFNVRGE